VLCIFSPSCQSFINISFAISATLPASFSYSEHAGSSHQNWARMEFSSCCTDRLELSSGTSVLNTD